MHNKTWLPLAACALSISLWFFFSLVIDALPRKYSAGSAYSVYRSFTEDFGNSLAWWAVAIIGILVALGTNLAVTALQRVFFPTDRNLWQEMEKRGDDGGVPRTTDEVELELEERRVSGAVGTWRDRASVMPGDPAARVVGGV